MLHGFKNKPPGGVTRDGSYTQTANVVGLKSRDRTDSRPMCLAAWLGVFRELELSNMFNSLWPREAIWHHRSGSILAQVMACCLNAPSQNLNNVDSRLSVSIPVQFHRKGTRYAGKDQHSKFFYAFARGQWVKTDLCQIQIKLTWLQIVLLTHWGLMMHICVTEHYWFRYWPVFCLVSSH